MQGAEQKKCGAVPDFIATVQPTAVFKWSNIAVRLLGRDRSFLLLSYVYETKKASKHW